MEKKYHGKAWLRQEYVEKKRTTTELANECGVTSTTICDWLDRHDIERRSHREAQEPDSDYTDSDWLKSEYVDKRKSMHKIANECDVTAATILKWLRRHNIDTRQQGDYKYKNPPNHRISRHGYEVVRSKLNGEQDRVYIHQLLAIAEGADPDKVFSDGEWHCHHKNGIRWDNRSDNIDFKRGSEHMADHYQERKKRDTGEVV